MSEQKNQQHSKTDSVAVTELKLIQPEKVVFALDAFLQYKLLRHN